MNNIYILILDKNLCVYFNCELVPIRGEKYMFMEQLNFNIILEQLNRETFEDCNVYIVHYNLHKDDLNELIKLFLTSPKLEITNLEDSIKDKLYDYNIDISREFRIKLDELNFIIDFNNKNCRVNPDNKTEDILIYLDDLFEKENKKINDLDYELYKLSEENSNLKRNFNRMKNIHELAKRQIDKYEKQIRELKEEI